MGRSDTAIRRCWQEWVENGRFQRHNSSDRPRATADQEDRLIVRLAVTALDQSDESRFQLCPDGNQRRAWRRPGQRADTAFTIARHTYSQPVVMVWSSISFDSLTHLVVIRKHTYSTVVRRRHSENCFATVSFEMPFLIFQQDNARPQMARVAMNCLTDFQILLWSGSSPDLSPIEHVWDMMGSCQVIYSQFGLAIHQNDHQARRRFAEWAQNEIAVVPDFHKRILFSDEAHFWLNGYVNKQNCRIWSEANPQVYVETPLHPEKLTVWCALWAGGIIGPYFLKNDEGHNVTVNGDRYRAMITNFFIPELNNHDVQELWFQQDGATCHTVRATIDLLRHVW
ncbi:transposable element Tc1 transposase [Trichonephila clavipes]|nr:transposable element Tc1 transposase [Trichonephila clavipes]